MPNYVIVGPLGPECMDFGIVEGGSPLLALRNLHLEAVPCGIRCDRLVFANPRSADVRRRWRIVECGRNGREGRRTEITIMPPVPAAA